MRVQRATKRTFYIERYGHEYRLVKVWEVGAEVTGAEMDALVRRVFTSDPDERIIAEQAVSIAPGGPVVQATADTPERAAEVARAAWQLLRGERPEPPAEEPR